MPENIKHIFYGIVAVLIALALGRLIGTGQSSLVIILFVLFIGGAVSFRFRPALPAVVFGMAWYSGENIFVKLPYVTLAICAFCAVSTLHAMSVPQRESGSVFTSRSVRFGILALFGMAAVLIGLTFFRHVGICSRATYGEPGGLRHALTVAALCGFTIMGQAGHIRSDRFWIIPAAALWLAVFNAILDTINYISPATAYYTYFITSSMSHEVVDVLTGGARSVFRLTALRELGFYFAMFVLCRFIQRRNSGGRKSVPITVLIALVLAVVLVVVSGFRSYVIRLSMVCIMAFWVYDRKLAWWSALGIGGLWGGV
ncbi:MAG: hypothetical protein HN341_04730, partial [Verrucomicrobia bacterium]|nr:hypothetical protein [Verrucomicrobiota bacterium]